MLFADLLPLLLPLIPCLCTRSVCRSFSLTYYLKAVASIFLSKIMIEFIQYFITALVKEGMSNSVCAALVLVALITAWVFILRSPTHQMADNAAFVRPLVWLIVVFASAFFVRYVAETVFVFYAYYVALKNGTWFNFEIDQHEDDSKFYTLKTQTRIFWRTVDLDTLRRELSVNMFIVGSVQFLSFNSFYAISLIWATFDQNPDDFKFDHLIMQHGNLALSAI